MKQFEEDIVGLTRIERDKLKEEISTLRTRLVEVEADAEVMREALMVFDQFPRKCDERHFFELREKSLATNAGKPLLKRLKEAEVLLGDDSLGWMCRYNPDWLKRRDALLNPKPQPTNRDL